VPTPNVDVEAILDTLEGHDVEFVVIGGFGVELHDVAVAPTEDVDITPAANDANLERLASALTDLDARFRVFDGPPGGVAIPGGITRAWLSSMVSISLTTSAGPLDINIMPDGTAGFDDLVAGAAALPYGARVVPVAGLEDIIRSKEAAGREKDLRVIPALRAHLRRRQRDAEKD